MDLGAARQGAKFKLDADYLPYCPECRGKTETSFNFKGERVSICKTCGCVFMTEYVRGFWHGVIRANKEGLTEP